MALDAKYKMLKRELMQNIIYKFLPIERLTYLDDELLRVTQPSELNDPFEFLPASPSIDDFNYVLDQSYKDRTAQIEKLKIEKSQKKQLRNDELRLYKTNIRKLKNNEPGNLKSFFLERAAKQINSLLGIISFTRRCDSTLMWSHYTGSHKGFCIGFDANAAFFSDYRKISDIEKIFMPVTYRNDRIKIPMEKGIKIDFQVVLSKSTDWSYEEEERLLLTLHNAEKVIKATPYDIHLFRIPHVLVREIILGVNFPLEKIDYISNFCSSRDITLYRSKVSEYYYDMERELFAVD